jgi:hypothetical protein
MEREEVEVEELASDRAPGLSRHPAEKNPFVS